MSVEALRAELTEVDALISAHPLASKRVRAADDVIASAGSTDVSGVDHRLAAAGLPSTDELGKAYAAGLWSWWKLHRRKRNLIRQIGRIAAR